MNAASCAFAAVQTAVASAAAGSTVQIPAGDCNWGTSKLVVPGGIHLRGAGKNATVIRRGGAVGENQHLVAFDCANGKPATFSDATLVGYGTNGVDDKCLAMTNGCVDFRIFNSKITKCAFGGIEVTGAMKQRGVIYDNEIVDNYVAGRNNLGYGVVVYADGTWPPLELGTQNAVFVEDNMMSGNRHHVASNNSSRYVFRHNTVVATDLTKDWMMTDAHGLSSSPRGSRSWEIYENTYSGNLSAGAVRAAIGMRGGDGVAFNNTMTSNIAYPIELMLEGFPCGTYPAQDQIRSAYFWNNAKDGAPVTIRNDCAASIQLGRDYFTSAKPGYAPYAYPHPLR